MHLLTSCRFPNGFYIELMDMTSDNQKLFLPTADEVILSVVCVYHRVGGGSPIVTTAWDAIRQSQVTSCPPPGRHSYLPQTKLREGNVFTPVCQSFCSQEETCLTDGCVAERDCFMKACMAGGVHGRGVHGRGHALQ